VEQGRRHGSTLVRKGHPQVFFVPADLDLDRSPGDLAQGMNDDVGSGLDDRELEVVPPRVTGKLRPGATSYPFYEWRNVMQPGSKRAAKRHALIAATALATVG
jgi:hypothetical protein